MKPSKKTTRAVEQKLAGWIGDLERRIEMDRELLAILSALKASDYPNITVLREAYAAALFKVSV